MGKYKEVNLFSQDKRAIGRFFISLVSVIAGTITGTYLFSLIDKQKFDWASTLLIALIVYVPLTLSFFIGRWVAFRSKLFPKAKNRDMVMGLTFIILSIILIVLAITVFM